MLGIFATVNAQEAANLPLDSINTSESRFYLDEDGDWVFFAKTWDSEFWFYLNDSRIRLSEAPQLGEETIRWNAIDNGSGFVSDGGTVVWQDEEEPRNYHKTSLNSSNSLFTVVTQDNQLFVGYGIESMTLIDGRPDDSSVTIVDATWISSWQFDYRFNYAHIYNLVIVYSDGNVVYWDLPEITQE